MDNIPDWLKALPDTEARSQRRIEEILDSFKTQQPEPQREPEFCGTMLQMEAALDDPREEVEALFRDALGDNAEHETVRQLIDGVVELIRKREAV